MLQVTQAYCIKWLQYFQLFQNVVQMTFAYPEFAFVFADFGFSLFYEVFLYFAKMPAIWLE